MFTEDDLLPISALQHLEFCPRRLALIHIEGMWTENAQTAEGRVLHERVHQASAEMVAGVRTARGLWLNSRELGLFGIADLVEFHPLADDAPAGAILPNAAGRWLPFPVEYKRGKRKAERSYFVQLCARPSASKRCSRRKSPPAQLYHGQSRRRQQVAFDAELRRHTRDLARRLHELIASGRPPSPEYGPKCKFCSLLPQCVPKLPPSRSARDYLDASVREALGDP